MIASPKSKAAEIFVGYRVGPEPEPLSMKPRHTIISGATGHGKTSLGEAMMINWTAEVPDQKFVVFLTKDGEEQFKGRRRIKPFYKQKPTSDWRYLAELIEMSEKDRRLGKDETALLGQITKGTKTLDEVIVKLEAEMAAYQGKERKPKRYDTLFLLSEYLEKLKKDLSVMEFAASLDLHEGINVMDLSGIPFPTQAAIIAATLTEIHLNHRHTSPYISDAALFLPPTNKKKSPCVEPASLIGRLDRVKENWLIIDTQDLAGIDGPEIRINVANYFLGKQQYAHEVGRTKEALNMPIDSAPNSADILGLMPFQFYFVHDSTIDLIFAKPLWMDEQDALKCATDPDYVQTFIDGATRQTKAVAPAPPAFANQRYQVSPLLDDKKAEPPVDQPSGKVKAFEEQVGKLEAEVSSLKERLAGTEARLAESEIKRNALRNTIDMLTTENREMRIKLDNIRQIVEPRGDPAAEAVDEIERDREELPNNEPAEQKKVKGWLRKDTWEGKIALLILDKHFRLKISIKGLHRLLVRHFGVDKDYKSVRSDIEAAMTLLQTREYGLVYYNKNWWYPTAAAKKATYGDLMAD